MKKLKIESIKRVIITTIISAIACTELFEPIISEANEYWPEGVEVNAESAVVMELETGTVLYEKNPDEIHYPASITKIMTALVVLENSELDETVVFSPKAVYENEGDTSHIARDVDERMSVEDTLYGMMLESANECAWALSEHCAEDTPSFVNMMNEKAKELGCKNTHFNNPNGLPDEEHYTTAYDMALISKAAFEIPKFAEITGTKNYTIQPTNKHADPTYLRNHHNMLHSYNTSSYVYEYCAGGKTGYTVVAGSTLVTYAKRDNMTLVCVVMKDKAPGQYIDTRNLFDYCFDNFSLYNVSQNASISDKSTTVTGKIAESEDLIKIDEEGVVVLPKTASFYDAEPTVTSFSSDEDKSIVGKISYRYADRDVGSAKLIFSSRETSSYPFDNVSIEKGGSGKEYIQVNYLKIASIIVIIILVILLILFIKSKTSDILLYRHRYKMKHPKKPATDFKKIKRHNERRRKKKFFKKDNELRF